MSKSYGNTINLSDDAETVRKKVMQMYTTRSEFGPICRGRSKATPSSRIIDAFNPDTAEVEDLKTRYRAGKVGDVEVKTKLAKALNAHLEPMRAPARSAWPDRRRFGKSCTRGRERPVPSRRKRWSACAAP